MGTCHTVNAVAALSDGETLALSLIIVTRLL